MRPSQAREHWDAGRPLEAGRTVYERLPSADRPRWAGELLAVTYLRARRLNLVARLPNVERVLAIATEEARWPEARQAHGELQGVLVDESRQSPRDLLRLALLAFAEVVAKVTYNASGQPDPFERSAGPRVATALRAVLAELADGELEAACVKRMLQEV